MLLYFFTGNLPKFSFITLPYTFLQREWVNEESGKSAKQRHPKYDNLSDLKSFVLPFILAPKT